jgi:hypothetical protein
MRVPSELVAGDGQILLGGVAIPRPTSRRAGWEQSTGARGLAPRNSPGPAPRKLARRRDPRFNFGAQRPRPTEAALRRGPAQPHSDPPRPSALPPPSQPPAGDTSRHAGRGRGLRRRGRFRKLVTTEGDAEGGGPRRAGVGAGLCRARFSRAVCGRGWTEASGQNQTLNSSGEKNVCGRKSNGLPVSAWRKTCGQRGPPERRCPRRGPGTVQAFFPGRRLVHDSEWLLVSRQGKRSGMGISVIGRHQQQGFPVFLLLSHFLQWRNNHFACPSPALFTSVH